MVQREKNCSWIFLYWEIVVILHCHSGDRCWVLGDGGHYTSVPPSLQNRFKSVPLEAPLLLPRVGEIEDSTAGYSAIEGNTITNKFHY